MARLSAPLGYRKPAEPIARPARRWFDGIATALRTAMSDQREPDADLGHAVGQLHRLD